MGWNHQPVVYLSLVPAYILNDQLGWLLVVGCWNKCWGQDIPKSAGFAQMVLFRDDIVTVLSWLQRCPVFQAETRQCHCHYRTLSPLSWLWFTIIACSGDRFLQSVWAKGSSAYQRLYLVISNFQWQRWWNSTMLDYPKKKHTIYIYINISYTHIQYTCIHVWIYMVYTRNTGNPGRLLCSHFISGETCQAGGWHRRIPGPCCASLRNAKSPKRGSN